MSQESFDQQQDKKDYILYTAPEEEVKESGKQEEAFNEETGEINWDCPCLGPMTQPPCGETFKAAFSCFVYSKEEPKGADCVELFRDMQDCFRQHPDIYGQELSSDEEPSGEEKNSKEEEK